MDSPRQTLDGAVDRANEIIWWNRALTKLNQFDEFDNAEAFVYDQLVEQKGPYVEYVRTPKSHDRSAEAFLTELGYDPLVIDAVVDVLFDGDGELPLYQHQAEMIQAIEKNSDDNILAVPTATGKTESFFLPLLNDCVRLDENGLKGIIVYPMKTLEVDQLNRFIRYLDKVNRNLPAEEKVKIGIWDGDTENAVGNQANEIEPGSPVRGLVCPRSREKLRVYDDYRVGTETEEYSWIRVTRDGIRADDLSQSLDILITNPEALDFLYVNDRRDSRNILGETPSEHPVKHIVYDEAHVWSGIKGAAISLLSRRLKHFYADREPQISMVSATVKNPAELAGSLTGTSEDEINEVGFTAEPIPTAGTPDFSRIRPCTLDELIATLYFVSEDRSDVMSFDREYPELENARRTALEVGILQTMSGILEVSPDVRSWLVVPIQEEVASLEESRPELESGREVVKDPDTLDALTESLLESDGLTARWRRFVEQHVPEVAELAQKLEGDTGDVGFRKYDEILADIRAELDSNQDVEAVLNTVLLFGRLAGLLTDKYHVFLRPPSSAYWCEDCNAVRRQKACPVCRTDLPELEFCQNCHYPYMIVIQGERAEPFGRPDAENCPGCGERHNTRDINVPTSTLLTFMLTELCRLAPSKKTLVFSDSRSTSETVAKDIREQEYLLMAETLYVKYLIEEGGVAETSQLFYDIRDDLRELYYEPLIANAPESEGVEDYLNELLMSIRNNASLHNCWHLLTAAIVTPERIYQSYVGEDLALAHAVYRIFAEDPGYRFTRKGRKIQGWTYERLDAKLDRDYQFDGALIERQLPNVLNDLVEINAIRLKNEDEVHEELQNQSSDTPIEETKSYLQEQQQRLDKFKEFNHPSDSGVFTRELQNDDSKLRLVPAVVYCRNCYTAMPARPDQADLSCPNCNDMAELYDRFHFDDDGYTGRGYANVDSGWRYALDHWAHDISSPLTERDELEPIVVGQHKGDMPAALRGSIEEGFRKSDPGINIVSATPTMELGVDIGTLETVTQVGIPPTLTNYVQRSGRTGRSQGSASLVTTVVQASNPVDSHYFSDLDSFFSSYEEVRVPDPMEFDELLAGQIVTETVGYLARNQGSRSVFEKIYRLNESTSSPRNFSRNVRKKLIALRRYVSEQRPDIKDWVVETFGSEAEPIFDEVFGVDSRYSMEKRSQRTFGEMEGLDVSGKSAEKLSSNLDRLDLWLQRLGYLSNYRAFGSRFPVNYRSRDDNIQFAGSGRLFEMFPGPENGRGGEIVYLGTKYIVDDVKGRERLTTVALCKNEECERPYGAFQKHRETCPLCGDDLFRTAVHRIGTVHCRSAAPYEQNYRSYPIVTSYVEELDSVVDREVIETSLFGIDCSLIISQFKTLSFVPAFERVYGRGQELKLAESEAVIDIESEEEEDFDEMDLDSLIDETGSEKYAPVGQEMRTNGLKLEFDLSTVEERYRRFANQEATASWSQVIVSLEQAFKKAIAVVAPCNLDDFEVKAVKADTSMEVFVTDGREGGNGISWLVSRSIFDTAEFEDAVIDVVECDECNQYCNQCLLLERTPGFYLENDLLHRRMVLTLLGKL